MSRAQLKQALILHQIDRLKGTYSDFLADEFHVELAKFFFDRLYSTTEKEKRDQDFRRLYEYFRDRLGADMVDQLSKLVEVNALTDRLDELVLDQFEKNGVGGKFTSAEYELAYRQCDNYDDRRRQIELLGATLVYFHRMSHWHTMGFLLKAVKLVAKLKGAEELGNFLYDGYRAFLTVKVIDSFSAAMRDREIERLDRIWRDYPKREAGAGGTKKKAREGAAGGTSRRPRA
ncbi:MAG: hypothetical protein HZA54_07340 [Planctomycetes bacterium]|nr:hypothetical protein [Planctomycetota bacterium]